MAEDRTTRNRPVVKFGSGVRMASVVLLGAVVAVVTHVVVAGLFDGLDIPAQPGSAETTTLAPVQSLVVGAMAAGAAMLVAALLLPRVTNAIRMTQAIGLAVLVLSLVPIALSWGDLASPSGLVVLHVVVGIVVLVGLDWAMDDVATADA